MNIEKQKFYGNLYPVKSSNSVFMDHLFHHTKKILKKFQEDLKNKPPVERFHMPDSNTQEIEHPQVIAISQRSIAKATLTIIGILVLAYFLFEIRDLIIFFFIALFFAAAIDPFVDWFESKGLPRAIGVATIYLLLLGAIIAILGSLVPVLINQLTSLASFFAEKTLHLIQNLQNNQGLHFIPEPYRTWLFNSLASVKINDVANQFIHNFSGFTNQIKDLASGSLKTIGTTVGAGVSVAGSIASTFFSMIFVLTLTFFMAVDKSGLHDFFYSLFPPKYGSYISDKTRAIQKQIGAWLRGQLMLSLIMFIIAFVGLIIIGMKDYALTLALVFGIGEFVPYIGPLIFLIFSFPIALGMGFIVLVKLLILYLVLQFVDGNIIVPAIMKKAVGLSPIVVLMVLIIGFKFLGVIGAVIAVPVTTAAAIFLSDYMQSVAQKK